MLGQTFNHCADAHGIVAITDGNDKICFGAFIADQVDRLEVTNHSLHANVVEALSLLLVPDHGGLYVAQRSALAKQRCRRPLTIS